MPSRRPIQLAYERHPLRIAMDAAPGPDLYDRLGKLLRIVRRNLSPDEWAELGSILRENGAEDDAVVEQADGDVEKLLAPRSLGPDGRVKFRGVGDDDLLTPEKVRAPQAPIKAGSVGPKDYWAQDSFNEMFPDGQRLKIEPGYGADTAKPQPQERAKAMNIAESNKFHEMFPDAKKTK
jgi:hypothetical protein